MSSTTSFHCTTTLLAHLNARPTERPIHPSILLLLRRYIQTSLVLLVLVTIHKTHSLRHLAKLGRAQGVALEFSLPRTSICSRKMLLKSNDEEARERERKREWIPTSILYVFHHLHLLRLLETKRCLQKMPLFVAQWLFVLGTPRQDAMFEKRSYVQMKVTCHEVGDDHGGASLFFSLLSRPREAKTRWREQKRLIFSQCILTQKNAFERATMFYKAGP